jgi:hypothetical protein
MSTYKESRTIKHGHYERRVQKTNPDLMNVRSLLVQIRWYDLFLDPLCSNPPHLNLGLGAAAWRTHFRSDFEQSGWRSSIIFDIGGALLQKRTTGATGR